MSKPYYIIRTNPKTGKRTITLDGSITPTPVELQAVQTYVNAGYEIRFKSEKRAKIAAERAKKTGFGGKKKATATEA